MTKKLLMACMLVGLTLSSAYAKKKITPIDQSASAKQEKAARKLLSGEFQIDPAF